MRAKRSVPAPVITELPEIGVTVISKWLYNCYVIHDGGDGQPFVVDLGLPSQLPFVADVLSERGSDVSELGAAVATHGHADHVGQRWSDVATVIRNGSRGRQAARSSLGS